MVHIPAFYVSFHITKKTLEFYTDMIYNIVVKIYPVKERGEKERIMKSFFRKAAALVCAAAICSVCAVSAFADYVFDLTDKQRTDEIIADEKNIDGTQAKLTIDFGTDDTSKVMMSTRYVLFDNYLDAEFWNDPDVTVSIDVKLETEGADVIAFLPGFDGNWSWIDPSKYTTLTYGEWVTVTESGQHFYEGFKKNGPNRILLQIRSQWGKPGQGVVTVSIKDFRINGGAASVVTTAPVEVTQPAEETAPITEATPESSVTTAPEELPEEVEPTAESVQTEQPAQTEQSAESADTKESAEAAAPVQSSASAAPDTTAQTTVRTAPPASSIDYSMIALEQPDPGMSIAKVLLIVGGSAAGIIGIGVVIFIIWKKKKFY